MRSHSSAEPEIFRKERNGIAEATLEARGVRESWCAPVAIIEAPHGFGEDAWFDQSPETVISWLYGGGTVRCEWGPRRGRIVQAGLGLITLQPRGAPNHFSAQSWVKFGQLVLSERLIARVAKDLNSACVGGASLRADLVDLADPVLLGWTNDYAARAQCETESPSTLEMEARAILIVERLISHHHAFPKQAQTGGLARARLKRTCEAMMAHLGDDIGLEELATIAGCSPTHFSRAFKCSTGLPPFQWMNERRMEKAKELLADPKLSLAEIALAVGFAGQSQFTTAFRRVTGTSPGAHRRSRL